MSDQSLEFHDIKDDLSSFKAVRKSFRIPVKEMEDVWVEIISEKYSILDISEGGISVTQNADLQFEINQKLNNCKLHLDGESIDNLNGLVVHFSSDSDKQWQYGIQWVDLERETIEKLSEIINRMKARLLEGE